jgi:hypothetical protein
MLENFLEEMRFFSPTPELTKNLFAAIAAVRLSDQIRAREDKEQAEDVEDDYLKNLPPDGTAEANSASPPLSAPEQDEILFQQRFIAEELYHHLAFLARGQPAKSGRPLRMKEAVADGMGNVLGLPQEEPLLGELANEFNSWLSELGQFTTGWGNIILADGNRLYLEERHPLEREAGVLSKRVLIPRQSSSRERAGRKRQAGRN